MTNQGWKNQEDNWIIDDLQSHLQANERSQRNCQSLKKHKMGDEEMWVIDYKNNNLEMCWVLEVCILISFVLAYLMLIEVWNRLSVI